VERLLVDRLRDRSEFPLLYVVEREFDIPAIPDASTGIGILRDDILVNREHVLDRWIPELVRHSCSYPLRTVVVVSIVGLKCAPGNTPAEDLIQIDGKTLIYGLT